MSITLAEISSPNGQKDYVLDVTGALETGEVLTGTPTVVPRAGGVTVSDIAINAAQLTNDETGGSIAIGKAIQFRVATTAEMITPTFKLDVTFEGNGGTKADYEINLPVVKKHTN